MEHKHTNILKHILEELIQKKIPNLFGILKNKDNEQTLPDYKLFHSYVKYGDFFYITTEYLHTMSNISHYSYIYNNSLLLEELLYAITLNSTQNLDTTTTFLQDAKIEYELKKFRIELKYKPKKALQDKKLVIQNNYQIHAKTRKNTHKHNNLSQSKQPDIQHHIFVILNI